jgi:hypothetical protein
MKRTSTSSYSRDYIVKSLVVVVEDSFHSGVPKKLPTLARSSVVGSRRRKQPPCLVALVLLIVIFSISGALVSKRLFEQSSKIAEQTHKDDEGRLLRHHDASLAAATAAAAAASSSSSNITNNNMTVVTSAAPPLWYWIGIVRDATEIQPAIWNYMVQLNCPLKNKGREQQQQPITVHILVGINKEYGIRERDKRLEKQQQQLLGGDDGNDNCAPFLIEDEHDDDMIRLLHANGASVPVSTNNISRVERIARIRDAQRERLRSLWKKEHRWGEESVETNNNNNNNDIVMVADLDLYRFPPFDRIIAQIQNMNGQDAVCAAGVTMAAHSNSHVSPGGGEGELWYYDTFALVFLPDTFAHPLKRRLVKHFYTGEDYALVRSDNQNGHFTQGDIMRHLKKVAAARSATTGTAPVRSCFAGLAIYRASTYFTDECQYSVQLPPPPSSSRGTTTNTILPHPLYRYASEVDGRPCEHVVFHTCLHDTATRMIRPPVQIAVNPNLVALWKKN